MCFCTTVPCFYTTLPFFALLFRFFFTTEHKQNSVFLYHCSVFSYHCSVFALLFCFFTRKNGTVCCCTTFPFFFIRDNETKRNSVFFNFDQKTEQRVLYHSSVFCTTVQFCTTVPFLYIVPFFSQETTEQSILHYCSFFSYGTMKQKWNSVFLYHCSVLHYCSILYHCFVFP